MKEWLSTKKDQLKNHYRAHKSAYHAVGIAGIAVGAFFIGRGVGMRQMMRIGGTNVFIHKSIIKDGPLFKVFNIYGPGFKNHGPSWMVKCKETGVVFRSQEHAARTMGLDPSSISRHLNSNPHFKNVHGYTFERFGMAA